MQIICVPGTLFYYEGIIFVTCTHECMNVHLPPTSPKGIFFKEANSIHVVHVKLHVHMYHFTIVNEDL